MATFDYALGYRLLNYNSKEAQRAGAASGQQNEAQCATSVSAWAFWHGFTNATILGNAKDRYNNAKAAGYKVGKEVKPWSWICFNTGYYGKYGHIMAIYDVVDDYVYYCEANYNGDGKLSEDDMTIIKCKVTDLTSRAGYQGCIYIAETFPNVTPINLDYHYDLTGNKTKLNKNVKFIKYKVNCAEGLNYREFPNGRLIGVFKNETVINVFENSEQIVNNLTWVKIDNGYYCAKKYLTPLDKSVENLSVNENASTYTITTIEGLDLSYFQSKVNFNKVKELGFKFVILRGGYGNALAYPKQYDTMFESHYKNARAAGLDIGVYWYSYAKSVEDAKQEAQSCIKIMKDKKFEYPIYFDIEEQSQFKKGKSFCDSIVTAFCEELANAGYYPGLYCSTYWITTCISESVRTKYPTWIAEYNSKCTYKNDFGMWQNGLTYLEGTGNVDHDFCYIDYPSIIKAEGKNGYTITPTPTPKPVVETYTKYYANDKSGVNYRKTPNGELVGTYKYGEEIYVLDNSDTKKDNNIWVKAKNGYWSVKTLLSTTKPVIEEYKTYYANDKSGVNYRETPNGKLVGTYKYADEVSILVGSETSKDNNIWVKAKNKYWSVKSLLSTTKPKVDTYTTMYANNLSGVNYRKTPNGQLIGTYSYGQAIQVLDGSDTKVNGKVWVKASNGYWSSKSLLITTNPIQYKTYYAADKSGVNYRKTPNGQLMGTYYYGQAIRVIVGSETTTGGIVWVKASNGYWSAKNILSTTKVKL